MSDGQQIEDFGLASTVNRLEEHLSQIREDIDVFLCSALDEVRETRTYLTEIKERLNKLYD
jgi:hypothetical protein